MTEQFNSVRLDAGEERPSRQRDILCRCVTGWISGARQFLQFPCDLKELLHTVAGCFEMEVNLLRIYALLSPAYSWKSRIRLTEENFEDYFSQRGAFEKYASKLYAIEDDKSPSNSPGVKKAGDGEGSQSSKSSNRYGQGEFSASVRRRDGNKCIFCNSVNEPLQAAHIIPVEQREILNERDRCMEYQIGSIMDTANGILLCWDCHKCFDTNLVCIDPINGRLLITDALLGNMPEKWRDLVDKAVPDGAYMWPSKALLQFRKNAMQAATQTRH